MQRFCFGHIYRATEKFFQFLSQLDHSQQGLVSRQVDQQVKVAAVVFLPLGDGAACRSSCWRAPWPARLKPPADRQIFRLDEEQWEAFVEALDASPQMHPRMARLLHKPTVLEQGSVGGARCAAIGSNRSRPTMPWML